MTARPSSPGAAALDGVRVVDFCRALAAHYVTLEQFGFGHEQLATDHPRLVYCPVNGHVAAGPRRGVS